MNKSRQLFPEAKGFLLPEGLRTSDGLYSRKNKNFLWIFYLDGFLKGTMSPIRL